MEAKVAAKPLSKREAFQATPVLLIADRNPKKPGSMSFDRFQAYFTLDWNKPQTVRTCIAAGVRMDDIRHDSEHGFIALGDDIQAHREALEAKRLADIEAARALLAEVDKKK